MYINTGILGLLQVWAYDGEDSVWHAFSHQEAFQRNNGDRVKYRWATKSRPSRLPF